MGFQVYDETAVLNLNRLIVPADGTALLPLVPAASVSRRIDAILAANRDTIDHVINVQMTVGAVVTEIGSVTVPAGAGYAGVPTVDLLGSGFPATQAGVTLIGTSLIGVQLPVAVVATFDVSVTAVGGFF